MNFCPPAVHQRETGSRERFRRLALSQTSKQNNFQFLLKEKGSHAKYKRLKENCFVLLAEIRQAETLGGIIQNPQADFLQRKF